MLGKGKMPRGGWARHAAFAAVLALPGLVCGAVTLKDQGTFVMDHAGVIDARTKRGLEALLSELARKTGAQVKVLTVATTEGEDFFGFVQRHAESWKLGQKGKDNGVLIALRKKSSNETGKVRIHPGYGLEPLLPDSWCGARALFCVVSPMRERRPTHPIPDAGSRSSTWSLT